MNTLTPSVLIVDDEAHVREVLRSTMEREGYCCHVAEDGPTALSLAAELPFELALLDIHLPGMNGIEILTKLRDQSPDTMVIMVTASSEIDTAIDAMKLGATDYVPKPFKLDELTLAAQRALEKRQLIIENREFHQSLQGRVRIQTAEIRRQKDVIDSLFLDTVAALAVALETKDRYTEGHSRRVTDYGLMLAKQMNLPLEFHMELERGGLLHDIGKIGTPDAILTKEGKLTPEEYQEIKRHPENGWTIVKRIRNMGDIVGECVRSHHERWDGNGYPDGLKEMAIPLPGRILALADAFDAMTSTRSYRGALSVAEALEQIRGFRGKQFDPELSDMFLDLMDQQKGSGGNILVIDDDRAITDLFLASLSPQGHRVIIANSGFQATRRATEEPFDIIYLDLNMPGIDGVQTLHALRGIRPDLFVVIITGMPDDPRIEKMIAEGAVTCLPKPFGVRDIIDITSQFLRERYQNARSQEVPHSSAVGSDTACGNRAEADS